MTLFRTLLFPSPRSCSRQAPWPTRPPAQKPKGANETSTVACTDLFAHGGSPTLSGRGTADVPLGPSGGPYPLGVQAHGFVASRIDHGGRGSYRPPDAPKALVIRPGGTHRTFFNPDLICASLSTLDRNRATDSSDPFATAFLLDVPKGGEEADQALLPEAVTFEEVQYTATRKQQAASCWSSRRIQKPPQLTEE